MPNIFTPLLPEYTLQFPQTPGGVVGWFVWLALLVAVGVWKRDRSFKLNRRSLAWLALLSILVLVLTAFFGIPMGAGDSSPHLMFLAAVPWLLAGGVLGLAPSMLLAGSSGLLLAYLDTHHFFTPLLFMIAALVFSLSVRQRYNSPFFRLLRFPLAAAVVSAIALLPLTFIAELLNTSGDLAARTVEAIALFRADTFALSGMLVVGGVVCVLVRALAGEDWVQVPVNNRQSAPQGLTLRYTVIVIPLALILIFVLVSGQWSRIQTAARGSFMDDLTRATDASAEGLIDFVQSSEQAVRQYAADPRLSGVAPEGLPAVLESLQGTMDVFDRLALLDTNGVLQAAYPPLNPGEVVTLPGNFQALMTSSDDAVVQTVAQASTSGNAGALVGFVAPVRNADGVTIGALWGGVDLNSASSLQPYLYGLQDVQAAGGRVRWVDDAGLVVYDSTAVETLSPYGGMPYSTAITFETVETDGSQISAYYHPVPEIGWAVIGSIPAHAVQLATLERVAPLLLTGAAAVVLVAGVAILTLSRVDRDMDVLARETQKITAGEFQKLDRTHHFAPGMKNFASGFRQMAGSMKTRLQAQSELLSVSEQITGQLKLKDSLQVVLMAALEHGISSARIVLLNESQPSNAISPDQKFGVGQFAKSLAPLDEDVLTVTRVRGQWIMRESQIPRNFHLAKGMPSPSLMVSIPLRWKNSLLGTFWVASDRRTAVTPEELAYLTDLAQKAATAVINSKAFDETLTTRKRLEALLGKLTDPVVLLDERRTVAYANDAARTLPVFTGENLAGKSVSDLPEGSELKSFLMDTNPLPSAKEINTSDGRSFLLSIDPVLVDGRQIGTACIFRDVTQFRQQDALKTEFVTTVSHELRSPLTLIHGYAKILRLTGNLNEQQDTYINNIIAGVDEMKSLVQNLLDLGRLDAGDTLDLETVTVSEIAKRVVDSMAAHARQKNVEVEVSLPDTPISFKADPTFLAQALKNLVDNAIKFSKSGGVVQLHARVQGDAVRFSVTDHGPGIAPLDQRKIFTRFFRSESQVGAEDRSGTGLGLAIVKSIAERHGGKVWFESKLGQGSTFTLQIPIDQVKSTIRH
ncbi:PAS domain-containing protein [bacterium]|nr:PAS domain-containing protein [bacterium]